MSTQQLHKWEPTGVTGYPITHPIVGQTDFYNKFKHWLPLVGDDQFAHVFAVVAPWGVGKSRLGYEIVAQVNDASKGWKVRGSDGTLTDAQLFDSSKERDQYLALYIRYSQVANRQLNLDNWFAPAVYKALAPLARANFDASIQHQIARQALNRLEAEGFDPAALAKAMEVDQHGEDIYTDTALATRLCNAAFEVLKPFGINHVVVVLDELETAAERATGGMEAEEARAMDGKSITMLRKAVELLGREDIEMMSKAVKEEDARARFPWLRFVALCSPAIGDELKEVQSTDRRFEIVDLSRNAFSDVSTFVQSLQKEGRLLRTYSPGLVEAAYMMSGANFGWFNVIMAVVDQVLRNAPDNKASDLAWIFQRAIEIQERIGRYVLDHRALDEIALDASARDRLARLLFGQQPRVSEAFGEAAASLLAAKNANGEEVALRYHKISWQKQECMQILTKNRFQRQSGTSKYAAPGIPEAIDLERLLDDLATLAVHEGDEQGKDGSYHLLIPEQLSDFLDLLDLIHPHPAAEETGRTLWMGLIGPNDAFQDEATHIGPSVKMLRRLDIRLRKASVGAVLREPNENEAFSKAQENTRFNEEERAKRVLTGGFRLVDQSWDYDFEPAGLGDKVTALKTPKNGFVECKAFWLHPKGQAVFAWVGGDDALRDLAQAVASDHRKHGQGRYPVLAFTTDYGLPERFEKSGDSIFKKARNSIVVVHLNSGEESALSSVGFPTSEWNGFRLRKEGFTTRFSERLSRIRGPIEKRIREWRQEVSRRGEIAWPIRPNGTLKDESMKKLTDGWRTVMLEHGGKALGDVGSTSGLDYAGILQELGKQGLSPAAIPKGYNPEEDIARFWTGEGPEARPEVPPFFLKSVALQLFNNPGLPLTIDSVKPNWFWGYTWDNNKTTDIFRQWMAIACDLGWAEPDASVKRKTPYTFVPRESLRGEWDAANNWLHDDDKYPRIVKELSELLGQGLIEQWFAPGKGSKYQNATKKLEEAGKMLDELDTLESNPPEADDDTAADWFVNVTRLRLQSKEAIHQVFSKQEYEELPEDLDRPTLQLNEEDRPLWERIRQAEYFGKAVRRIAKQIRERIPSLGEEIRAAATEIPSFPIALFTRPLSKLDSIVDAGLTGEDPSSTTKRVQHAKPDTLAYYLKDMKINDAMDALLKLAREVGVGERPSDAVGLDEIQGDIVSGFRDLKERYGKARSDLMSLTDRLQTLETAFNHAPLDFKAPSGTSFDELKDRPEDIEGALNQSLQDVVDELLEDHDKEMNLGRFGPLMREARKILLDSAERALKGLEGKVRTLENTVTAYRQELLKDEKLHLHRDGLNALRGVKGIAKAELPVLSDLENRSLHDGRVHINGLATTWAQEGEAALSEAGVSFAEWLDVYGTVKKQEDPTLATEKIEGLVKLGYLRRVYAIGGAP
jgi:hypothetical protein